MSDTRILKTKWFQRFARRERISDATLREAIARIKQGQIDSNLGGGVIKQRIARPAQGKSGGYRTIVLFRQGRLAVFMYGFAKSERDNIRVDEERAFKEAAKHVLALTGKQIDDLVQSGEFVEVAQR